MTDHPEYLLRGNALKKLAIDQGIAPTGRQIALAMGLPSSTINWMLQGRPPSNGTMATVTEFFDVPFDDLFERAS